MTASPTWYDVLGVEPDADPDEIRTAWRAAIADLDPGDRRFRSCNRAAEVLLDPARRAEYDAELAVRPVEPEPVDEPLDEPRDESRAESRADLAAARPVGGPAARSAGVPTWLLAGLLGLLLVAAGATAWVWTQESAGAVEESTRAAQTAAEQAVVPILSYDHQTLEQDKERAHDYLTSDYRKEYDKLIEVIAQNAPRTRTVVEAEVVSSGIVRSGEDRVEVLVFVDRPTTNKLSREPVVYKDQVTVTMQKVDDSWRVDEMKTSPPQQ